MLPFRNRVPTSLCRHVVLGIVVLLGGILDVVADAAEISVYDLDADDQTQVFETRIERPQWIELSPTGNRLITFDEAATRVWDFDSKPYGVVLSTAITRPWIASFTADGAKFAIIGEQMIEVWDAKTNARTGVIKRLGKPPERVTMSPDGMFVAVYAIGPTCEIWDVNSTRRSLAVDFRSESSKKRDDDNIFVVRFSPDEKTVAIGQCGGDVTLVDVASGQRTRLWDEDTLKRHNMVTGIAFVGKNGKTLAVAQNDEISLWDLKTDERQDVWFARPFEWLDALSLAGSDDGKYLTAINWYGMYWRWELTTGNVLKKGRVGEEKDASLSSYFLSSNGRYIASMVKSRNEDVQPLLKINATKKARRKKSHGKD